MPAQAPIAAPVAMKPAAPAVGAGCFVVLGLLLLLSAAGAVLVFLRTPAASTKSLTVPGSAVTAEVAKAPPAEAPVAPKPAEAPKPPAIESRYLPLVGDLDGDGSDDVVVLATIYEKGVTRRYLGLDGRTGRELFRTKDLGSDAFSNEAALENSRLILADRAGKLVAFDVKSGDEQWTTTLGERVRDFCAAKEPDAIRVHTNDNRLVAIDVKTGRQTPVAGKAKCERANSNGSADFRPPEDRSDPKAPRGVKSVVCGGVRVMGDRNFSIPDQCPIQTGINTNRLEGMSARALWKLDAGYLVIGSRQPGTRIPMLGLFADGKLKWKSDVPASNPLEAQEGAPNHVALVGKRVFASYEPQSSDKLTGISAFDVETGARVWSANLPPKVRGVSHMVAAGDTLIVTVVRSLVGISATDGKQRFLISDQD